MRKPPPCNSASVAICQSATKTQTETQIVFTGAVRISVLTRESINCSSELYRIEKESVIQTQCT